ncbi:hypothetical protein AMJ86_00720 [bacterium SM23_57]|nr:MAG: hypothetical protein AMJ86_00720 [bacterium SM23_57]
MKIKLLSHVPDTAVKQIDLANEILRFALSGDVNPLGTELLMKSLENVINLVRKDDRFREAVIDEISKYEEKSFSFDGAVITKGERKNYDFSTDPRWVALREQLKEREALLKNIPKSEEIITLDGEVIQRPEIKITDFYTIKFE